MKDIHSHLLYGIDDGCKDQEESIKILKKLRDAGVTDLILTPHYIEDTKYNCNNKEKIKIFREFQKRVEEENIEVNLYLGNEVFFTNDFISLINEKEILPLQNSKYILFEFSMGKIYSNALPIISNLTRKGYVPIMAHPERYPIFQKTPNMVVDYLKGGVHLQGNLTSLFGKYGRRAQKTLQYYLKMKWISFLGSDTHHDVKWNSKKLEKKLLRITKDPEYVKELMEENFDRIVYNQDLGMVDSREW